MRRAVLTLLFASIALLSHGQADIAFDHLILKDGKTADTLRMGEVYELQIGFQNIGAATTQSQTLRFYWAAAKIDTFPPANQFIFGELKAANGQPDSFVLPALSQFAKGRFSKSIRIPTDTIRPDTYNIVIIWPTESYQDGNAQNNVTSRPYYILPEDTTVGIKPENLNRISIAPNPTTGLLRITGEHLINFEMISLQGKSLLTIPLNRNNQQQVDISKFNAGVYLVRITSRDGVLVTKVLYQP